MDFSNPYTGITRLNFPVLPDLRILDIDLVLGFPATDPGTDSWEFVYSILESIPSQVVALSLRLHIPYYYEGSGWDPLDFLHYRRVVILLRRLEEGLLKSVELRLYDIGGAERAWVHAKVTSQLDTEATEKWTMRERSLKDNLLNRTGLDLKIVVPISLTGI